MVSKVGVFVCKLESKGGKYEVEVAAVLKVSRTEKGCSQETVGEDTLGDGLSDGRLSCPGEAVQPEDRRLAGVLGPMFDFVQDAFPGPLEAALSVSMLVAGPMSTTTVV